MKMYTEDTNIFETKTGALNLAPLKISGQYKIVVKQNGDLYFDDYKEYSSIIIDDYNPYFNNYYNSIKDENWDNLNKLYSNNLKRFYDNFNISKSSAIQSAKEYKTKHGIINSYTSIRWNTLKIKYSNNYTEIEFIMDYKIVRNEKSKPKDFILNIVMTIDDNKQINSVYENIMSKR